MTGINGVITPMYIRTNCKNTAELLPEETRTSNNPSVCFHVTRAAGRLFAADSRGETNGPPVFEQERWWERGCWDLHGCHPCKSVGT